MISTNGVKMRSLRDGSKVMRNLIEEAHLTYFGGYCLVMNVLASVYPLIVSKMKKRLTSFQEFEIVPVLTILLFYL